MDGFICWLVCDKCKHAVPPKKHTVQPAGQHSNRTQTYMIHDHSQLLGDGGYSLTNDAEVCNVGHQPLSLMGGKDMFTDGTHCSSWKFQTLTPQTGAECESTELVVVNWYNSACLPDRCLLPWRAWRSRAERRKGAQPPAGHGLARYTAESVDHSWRLLLGLLSETVSTCWHYTPSPSAASELQPEQPGWDTVDATQLFVTLLQQTSNALQLLSF